MANSRITARLGRRVLLSGGALLGIVFILSGCAARPVLPGPGNDYVAKIRRTEGGIPHIEATGLPSLGFGTMYAQAEDNLCILADEIRTFGAERTQHLGDSEANRKSDLFYQFLIDRGDAEEALPAELEALFQGAAKGYNHYLRMEVAEGRGDRRCQGVGVLRPAKAIDFKRISRIDYALSYMRPILLQAAPPEVVDSSSGRAVERTEEQVLASRIEAYLEVPKRGGSNGVAIGRDRSEGGGGLLLANPHMPWNEPFQRFYPMHQRIPGELDVLGANLIGRPRVGFGHTEHVAWTSTVSRAKRMSFYQLKLDPLDPTAYLFDGESMPLKRRVVTVSIEGEQGDRETVSHTFYETHFGALLVESPLFAWTRESAFAVRMLDAAWRGETSLSDQIAATSVRGLKAVHDRDQFLPVNLIAADRSGEVLYADPGPIPNLPDALVSDCAVMGGAALDGSRSACQWRVSSAAAAPGIFPPKDLPALFRTDYVTNSNDTYWLANPASPLTGFAESIGAVESPRTLRTRSGLEMIDRAVREEGGISLSRLQALALSNESYAGQLIRDDVVGFCRETQVVSLPEEGAVSLERACQVLADWDLHANLESRGALLFRQMMASAQSAEYRRKLPPSFTPRIPFDRERPVSTPRGLAPSAKSVVLGHLARAVVALSRAGIALDTPLGEKQGVTRAGDWIPIHGGPEIEGIFNKIESRFKGPDGYSEVDAWSSSWILAVELGEAGPRSFGFLTYSLSENPESPHFSDQTRRFSEKAWVPIPFSDDEVEAATIRSYEVRAKR